MSAPPQRSRRAALLPTAGLALVILGALGVVSAVLGFAFAPGKIPAVVRYANIAAAVVEIGVGLGVRRSLRAAWAFAVSLEGTLTLINLIALPQIAHAGTVGGISVAFAVARAGLTIVLAMGGDEV